MRRASDFTVYKRGGIWYVQWLSRQGKRYFKTTGGRVHPFCLKGGRATSAPVQGVREPRSLSVFTKHGPVNSLRHESTECPLHEELDDTGLTLPGQISERVMTLRGKTGRNPGPNSRLEQKHWFSCITAGGFECEVETRASGGG